MANDKHDSPIYRNHLDLDAYFDNLEGPPMVSQPATANPLYRSIQAGEDLLVVLEEKAVELSDAIEACNVSVQRLMLARETLTTAEADVVMEAEIAGADGPLAGIAKTSKAYGYALTKLLADAHDGPIAGIWTDVKRAEIQAENDKIRLEQAQIHFRYARVAAELRAAMLRASV